jgi:hypothetical protein
VINISYTLSQFREGFSSVKVIARKPASQLAPVDGMVDFYV